MTLFFTMLVPGILAAVAITGTVKRVDVYQGLADGAVDGMKILVRILPALVGLLTAVHMLRASGLLDWLAQALSPVLHLLGIPPETVGLMLIRPISGSGALGVGSELIQRYGPRFPHRPHSGGDAGQHGDDLLHHRRLLRRCRHPEHPLRHSGGAVCGSVWIRGCQLGSAPVFRRMNCQSCVSMLE